MPEAPTPPREAKIPLFGARNAARQHAEEAERLRGELARIGALEISELSALRGHLHEEIAALRQQALQERAQLERELDSLRQRVVVTREEEVLQGGLSETPYLISEVKGVVV
jgi:hypothetical protein